MRRLALETFDSFVEQPSAAAILFVAPSGEASWAQAFDFATAGSTCRDACFGYVDVFEEVRLARRWSVRVLPTVLIFRGGTLISRLEGRHEASTIMQLINGALKTPREPTLVARPTDGFGCFSSNAAPAQSRLSSS